MSFLEVKKVSRFFGGLSPLIKDVSFEVDKGEILGLIGPNGAGKTTLFNVVNGFYHPSRGEVFFKGRTISGLKPHQICQRGHRADLSGRQAAPADERARQRHRVGIPSRNGKPE